MWVTLYCKGWEKSWLNEAVGRRKENDSLRGLRRAFFFFLFPTEKRHIAVRRQKGQKEEACAKGQLGILVKTSCMGAGNGVCDHMHRAYSWASIKLSVTQSALVSKRWVGGLVRSSV